MRTRAASARATSREVITTDAPSFANALAIASPMPIDPPVMTAIFPFIRIMVLVVPGRRSRQAALRHMRSLAVGPQYNHKDEPSAIIPAGRGLVSRRAAAVAHLRAPLQGDDWRMPGAQRAVWRGPGAGEHSGRRGMHR